MTIDQLLRFALDQGAADIHLQTGAAPYIRIGGQMRAIDSPALTAEQLREFIRSIGPRTVIDDIDHALVEGADFSYSLMGHARFRCNLYSHFGTPGLVIRVIPLRIRTLDELHLPAVIPQLALVRRGLLLVSGATGSGKTTTLAGIVELLNRSFHLKILTIEDPVEYEHPVRKSLVSHVEVGRDTPSFEHGLRQAMRQAPDVILVGELRDPETVQMALRAADTGHQVLATIHASNAAQTIERLLAMVPAAFLAIARQQLAAALVGVISQRLVVGKSGELWPVAEVLRGGPVTSKYILEGRIGEITDYIATQADGMQTFDKHLFRLYSEGTLDGPHALEAATNPEALALEIRLPHGP
ncbi:MAG TPA: PilT/PilU family type 4a pilus ATPase [Planctomycetaceae bacterium]|nr:PilT/PilU family type 4a pilus ATPase [Planctomycetaceae bacterium]